jgi:hypothetical protein
MLMLILSIRKTLVLKIFFLDVMMPELMVAAKQQAIVTKTIAGLADFDLKVKLNMFYLIICGI